MTAPTKNRQWRLKSRPKGMVGEEHFELREEPVGEVRDGQVLVQNLYLSFDPAMRGWLWDRETYVKPVAIGEVMRASAVAQVLESKKPGFAVGDFVTVTRTSGADWDVLRPAVEEALTQTLAGA